VVKLVVRDSTGLLLVENRLLVVSTLGLVLNAGKEVSEWLSRTM
jgi:hypothetical protein